MSTRTFMACGACYNRDRSVVEATFVVVETHEDGTPARWYWECPACGAEIGFGADLGTVDLEAVRAAASEPVVGTVEIFAKPPPG